VQPVQALGPVDAEPQGQEPEPEPEQAEEVLRAVLGQELEEAAV
jgi:hypothetical protein